MMKVLRSSLLLILSLIMLSLTACGAAGNQTPTNDPSTVYTQVAQTVQAQITGNARLTPSATATVKPSETPGATATLRPSSTPFGTAAPTSLTPLKSGTAAPTSLTPQKTNTVAAGLPTQAVATVPVTVATQPGGASTADKMQYVSQKIADGSTFNQGQAFVMTWVIKNTGSTTWTTDYQVRLFAGDRFGAEDMKFSGTVKPGEQTNVTMDMTAPNTVGEYNSIWVLTNAEGRNFGSFTLNIKVK